jgi:hypothetical protein
LAHTFTRFNHSQDLGFSIYINDALAEEAGSIFTDGRHFNSPPAARLGLAVINFPRLFCVDLRAIVATKLLSVKPENQGEDYAQN